ncbi:hypothetical protein BpHYR1_054643 [Brachionus plicatilis]|uniref:Uncharacterized protein n=1 Tax=Brachionus plicatilis TaxID=10195 RepID=A0A3M7R1T3_BRAPC|nr:hypothetical protein BpHYR1_054643 [Brachionus plicatilis]
MTCQEKVSIDFKKSNVQFIRHKKYTTDETIEEIPQVLLRKFSPQNQLHFRQGCDRHLLVPSEQLRAVESIRPCPKR